MFARFTLEEFVARSRILAEVVVERIAEPRLLADNPDLPHADEFDYPEESARWLESGVRYQDVVARVLTPMKGVAVGA